MRRTRACILPVAAIAAIAATVSGAVRPTALAAQVEREPTIVGVVAGYVHNEGVWKPASESTPVGGVLLGGFANAATPIPWFAVRAELMWTQRGDDVDVVIGGVGTPGGVRSDYLTFTLHPRVSTSLGPLRFHVAAGPVIETLLRSRVDPSLAPSLQATSTIFGLSGGAGVGTRVAGRYRVEVEARIFRGFTDSYSGFTVSTQNRSLEFVARVGIPRPTG
jgi:hypothetical protein